MSNDIAEFVRRTQEQLTTRSRGKAPRSKVSHETASAPASSFVTHTPAAATPDSGLTLDNAVLLHALTCPPETHPTTPAGETWGGGGGGTFGGGGASDDFSGGPSNSFGGAGFNDITSAVRASRQRQPISRVLSL